MIKIILITILFYTNYLNSKPIKLLPPQGNDLQLEVYWEKFCHYSRTNTTEDLKKIIQEANSGSTIASHMLYSIPSNLDYIDNKILPKFKDILKLLVKNGNPVGYKITGLKLMKTHEFKDGVFYLERAANLGDISIISLMVEIYNGEEYPELKNKSLEMYWWRRYALSGDIYALRMYIYNNPEELSKKELKHWQDAYKFMLSEDDKKIYKSKYSTKTKTLLYEINNNIVKTKNMFKKHHPWFGNYRYCEK